MASAGTSSRSPSSAAPRVNSRTTTARSMDWRGCPTAAGSSTARAAATTMPYLPTQALVGASSRGRRAPATGSSPTSRTCIPTRMATATIVASRLRMQFDLWRVPDATALRQRTYARASASRIRPGRCRRRRSAPAIARSRFSPTAAATPTSGCTTPGDRRAPADHLRARPERGAGGADLVTGREVDCLCLVARQYRPGVWRLARESRRRQPAKSRRRAASASPGLPMPSGSTTRTPACSTKCRPPAARPCASGRARRATSSVFDGTTLYFMVDRTLTDASPAFEIHAATPEDAPSRVLARIPASRAPQWQIINPSLSPDGAVARDAAHRRRHDEHLDACPRRPVSGGRSPISATGRPSSRGGCRGRPTGAQSSRPSAKGTPTSSSSRGRNRHAERPAVALPTSPAIVSEGRVEPWLVHQARSASAPAVLRRDISLRLRS